MSTNTGDIVSKIVEANALESSGETERAIAIYQEILELDRGGNYGDVAQQALENLKQTTVSAPSKSAERQFQTNSSFWSRLSIKAKTSFILTGIALASGIGISSIGYVLADKAISQEVNRAEQAESYTFAKEIALFMRDRYGDIQFLSGLPIFTEPKVSQATTQAQKQASLDRFIETYGVYNSVAVFRLDGTPIAQSSGKTLGNHADRSYFQEVLKTDRPFISQPIFSKSSGIYSVYLVAPIKDAVSNKTTGIVRARMPVDNLQNIITGGLDRAYLLDAEGNVFVASSEADQQQIKDSATKDLAPSSLFDFQQNLQAEIKRRSNTTDAAVEQNSVLRGAQEVAYLTTLNELDAKFLADMPNLGWSTLVAIDRQNAFAAQRQLLQVFIIGTMLMTLIAAALSLLIADRATRPVVDAAEAVDKIGSGDLSVKLLVKGEDEIATLNSNINRMAGQIEDLLFTQEAETNQQRKEKEMLQQGVMGLLLDVEGAQKGDLTVKAKMTDGAIGSIADAFNTTISKLRGLLQEVQTVSTEVGELSLAGEGSVRQLSESALSQTQEINQALGSIDRINQSVATVANYAQEAAKIAREGSLQAKEGDLAMDATVNSIEKIRGTVANTSKKVKQLAESSQEIAQIVEIISGISEKTNLLAFNASVEAARAGEHGEGFRIVAEEVRRLADRITEATKDIQQLVNTIQQDTTSVLEGMETSTSEVVNGSELVQLTKVNLRTLADTSKQIDEYLKYITTSTNDQTNTSKVVNQKIGSLATIAQINSTEAQTVVESLQTLVSEAKNLQTSVSQFKLEA